MCSVLQDFQPIISVPVRNPNKTDWFMKQDFSVICTLVCYWLPIWGEKKKYLSPYESKFCKAV